MSAAGAPDGDVADFAAVQALLVEVAGHVGAVRVTAVVHTVLAPTVVQVEPATPSGLKDTLSHSISVTLC